MSNWNGITERVLADSDRLVVKYEQDVESVLDHCKRMKLVTDGWTPSRELRHRAHIPMGIAMKWLVELGVDVLNPDHKPAVRRLLNSNEYAFLRTSDGVI